MAPSEALEGEAITDIPDPQCLEVDPRQDSSGRLPVFNNYFDLMRQPEFVTRIGTYNLMEFAKQAYSRRDSGAVVFLCEEILKRIPENAKSILMCAVAYEQLREFSKSLELRYRLRTLRRDNINDRMIENLERYIGRQQDCRPIPILDSYQKLLDQPEFLQHVRPSHLTTFAMKAMGDSHWRAAEIINREIIRREPENHKAIASLSYVLQMQERILEAITYREIAFKLDPSIRNQCELTRLQARAAAKDANAVRIPHLRPSGVNSFQDSSGRLPVFNNYFDLMRQPEFVVRIKDVRDLIEFFFQARDRSDTDAQDYIYSEIVKRGVTLPSRFLNMTPSFSSYKDCFENPEYLDRIDNSFLLDSAIGARRDDNFPAMELFNREIVTRDPFNEKAISSLAFSLEAQGKLDEALPYRRRGLELNPCPENQTRLTALQTRIAVMQNLQFKSYKDLMGHLDLMDQIDISTLIGFAIAARADKDLSAAKLLNSEILKRNPRDFSAMVAMAFICEDEGKIREALKFMTRASEIKPDKKCLRDIVRLQAELKRRADACPEYIRPFFDDYTELLAQPQFVPKMRVPFLIWCAMQAMKAGDWAAVELFNREIVKKSPGNPKSLGILVYALKMQSKFAEAIPFCEELCGIDPSRLNRTLLGSLRTRTVVAHALLTEPSDEHELAAAGPDAIIAPIAPAPSIATPAAPTELPAEKLANIDFSRFDEFLNSLSRECETWDLAACGNGFRAIPQNERERLRQAISEFESQMKIIGIQRKASKTNNHSAFWNAFDTLKRSILSNKVHPKQIIEKLIPRLPAGIDWAKS